MEGRAETPEQKREILDQLFLLWCRYPSWRLGQLIYNAFNITGKSIYYVEDQEFIDIIIAHRDKLNGPKGI